MISKFLLATVALLAGFTVGWFLRPVLEPEPLVQAEVLDADALIVAQQSVSSLEEEKLSLQRRIDDLETITLDLQTQLAAAAAPAAPVAEKKTQGWDRVMNMAAQTAVTQYRQRTEKLLRELNLDASQLAAISQQLDDLNAVDSMEGLGEAVAALNKSIKEILTEEQEQAMERFESDERRNIAEMAANAEFMQLRQALDIKPEQEDAVFEALASAIQKQTDPQTVKDWLKDVDASAKPQAMVQKINQLKIDALAPILSAEQMAAYEETLQQQQKMIEAMMEDMPGMFNEVLPE